MACDVTPVAMFFSRAVLLSLLGLFHESNNSLYAVSKGFLIMGFELSFNDDLRPILIDFFSCVEDPKP